MITKIFPTLLALGVLTTLALILPSHAQNAPRDYVAAHNAARAAVGVGPVTWDAKVAAYAQSYANRLASRGCKLVHSGGPYGENLAWGKPDITGTASVKMWVDEKQYYNYNTNTCAPGKVCGHYTQVVWRSSTRIGCGRAVCPNRAGTIVSCNYNPPGNIAGQKPYLFISDN